MSSPIDVPPLAVRRQRGRAAAHMLPQPAPQTQGGAGQAAPEPGPAVRWTSTAAGSLGLSKWLGLSRWLGGCVVLWILLECAGCTGERGPAGVQGPPGEGINGTTRVARFDSPDDVATWQFSMAGTWQVTGGQLVMEGAPGERTAVGPSTRFSHDVDISVYLAAVELTDSTRCGVRFHVGDAGAYQLQVDQHGRYALLRTGDASAAGAPLAEETRATLPAELRVVRRGTDIKAYGDGVLVLRAADAALDSGYIELFVEGPGTVAFDELWVGTALPLEKPGGSGQDAEPTD